MRLPAAVPIIAEVNRFFQFLQESVSQKRALLD
jgi:hypothetical protein